MLPSVARVREYATRVFRRCIPVQGTASSLQRYTGLTVLFVVVGVLIAGHSVYAQSLPSLDDIGNKIILVIGELLNLLIFALGKFLIVLVGILIHVASYNNFVHAQPVQFGWVLVRDLTNMFFIVILLVSAFATIIGYPADFHYSKVLPKLLLMAVLINFSKTLIGLLIDFSQVIMLTFVSAFQQAAGGNFVKALKLDQLTTMSTEHPGATATAELFAAAVFGLFMLLVSITIIVIMIAFLVFRIITLWMLLIISPLAFFATALPSKIGSQLGGIGGDFWTKLKQALVAGPIMAFFLWLALAVVQSAPEPFGDVYSVKDASTETLNSVNFATKAGNGGAIAQFIVVVAFLLEGVEYAASTATKGIVPKSVMSGLGIGGGTGSQIVSGFLKNFNHRVGAPVAGAALGVAGFAATTSVRAATLGRVNPKEWDVKGFVGKQGLKVSGAFGGVGAATFAGLATAKKVKGQKIRSELEGVVKGLGYAEKSRYLHNRSHSDNPSEAKAAKAMLADMAMSNSTQKDLAKQYTEEAKAEILKNNPGMKGEELELHIAAKAEAKAVQERARLLEQGKKAYEELGMGDNVDKIKEAIKKNPALASDYGSLAEILNGTVEDPKKYISGITADEGRNSASALARLTALGIIDKKTNTFVDNDDTKEKLNLLIQGDRGRYFQAVIDAYKNNPKAIESQMKAINNPSDKDAVAKANESRLYITKVADKQGGIHTMVADWAKSDAKRSDFEPNFVPSANRVADAQIEAMRARLGPATVTNPAFQRDMVHAGATLAEAFHFNNAQGKFANTDQRNAFTQVAAQIDAGVQQGNPSALHDLANLDLEALRVNPDDFNEARASLAGTVRAGTLMSAYRQPGASVEQQKRVLELTEILKEESDRVRTILKENNIKANDVRLILTDPRNPKAMEAADALVSAGITNNAAETHQIAQTVDTGHWITTGQQFREVRGAMQSHAQARAFSARKQKYNPPKAS